MKKRTISQRNFVGALLGGILGILAFGYLHPIALPFGCFFGVIIGWWYQEIGQQVADSFNRWLVKTSHAYNRWLVKTNHAYERFTIFIFTPARKLKDVKLNIGPCLKVLHFCLFIFVWILRSPIVFFQWLKAHPMNRIFVLRILAAASFAILTALWAIPLAVWCWKLSVSAGKDSAVSLMIVPGFIIPFIAIVTPILLNVGKENTSSMRGFYRSWERYSADGPFSFFAKDVVNFLRCKVSVALVITGSGIWFLGIGGIFFFLIIVPISIVVGAVKGIYQVSKRTGHWLCFTATVIVTAFTAWLANPYLSNVYFLWIVALFAGLASAVATEYLRRALDWFFSANERIRAIATIKLKAQLAPSANKFCRISNQLTDIFYDLIPIDNFN